jgi:uncharacterized membrane protein
MARLVGLSGGLGGKFADKIAGGLGSWPFIIGQTVAIGVWMTVNVAVLLHTTHWDPYPFILLNLIFSIQAAYTGPILLISNNRQDQLQKIQEQLAEQQLKYILHLVEALRDQLIVTKLSTSELTTVVESLAQPTNPKESSHDLARSTAKS